MGARGPCGGPHLPQPLCFPTPAARIGPTTVPHPQPPPATQCDCGVWEWAVPRANAGQGSSHLPHQPGALLSQQEHPVQRPRQCAPRWGWAALPAGGQRGSSQHAPGPGPHRAMVGSQAGGRPGTGCPGSAHRVSSSSASSPPRAVSPAGALFSSFATSSALAPLPTLVWAPAGILRGAELGEAAGEEIQQNCW